MRIKEKLQMDYNGLVQNGPITIVAFGDSVTHGFLNGEEIDYDTVYWNILRKKLNAVRDYVPVNVINAGIGGITAKDSLRRLEKQVLIHEPDLVTICFGLNDVNGEQEEYIAALREIFSRCKKAGAEVIFLTPNMLNTRVAEDVESKWAEYAVITAEMQNSGKMDRFMDAARALADEMRVPVADAYAEWKKRSETEDITLLLANRINHPVREMHTLFADKLFEILMR